MRKLTPHERTALIEVGPPGEGPVPDSVFAELERLGYGYWRREPRRWWQLRTDAVWCVTEKGRRALELELVDDDS